MLKWKTKTNSDGDATSSPPSNTNPDLSDTASHAPETPSHISTSEFNRYCRDLLDLYRDLRELGAHMYFDLPRISVIGSQSAGKSSLVEAVSSINVPRASGTCTRCPMEIFMSQAEKWSCTISLRLQFDSNGNPYPTLLSEPFGPPLTEKQDVEIWLRRAQAAILSPHVDANHFHNMSKSDLDILRETDSLMQAFSKNTIYVDVKDPEVTNLSFIDLPGLIQHSETPSLIDLVKDLVVSNIKGDNTLILIAIPMSDDIENQQAVRLAKEADPTGERTIGVLTKPDVVLPSSMGQLHKWRDVLEGKTYPLEHGYYCVRLADEAERMKRPSRAESERLADGFFRTRDPWSKMSLRSRFGIPNLVRDVSTLLVLWIEKNLPTLRKKLNELLEQCRNEMGDLPPLIEGDPTAEILLRLEGFSTALHDAVGATEEKSLARQARRRYLEYKSEILRTAPDFRPFFNHPDYNKPKGRSGQDAPDRYCMPPMDLEYVRQVIRDSVGWELPGHVPYAATKVLVLKSASLWKAPSMACFEDVYEVTAQLVDDLVRKYFGRFPKAENYMRSLVNAALEDYKLDGQRCVEELLQSETEAIFTQNEQYFRSEQQEWYYHYNVIRSTSAEYLIYPRKGHTSPVGYEQELNLMSRVHGYFCVAFKRLADSLPLTIERSLNRALDSTLSKRLLEKLMGDPNYAESMAVLVEESPDLLEKRHKLSERQERLLQIKNRLDRLRNHENHRPQHYAAGRSRL
ncbi:P-loop containing nucleoside triphosphate hydrolase protein [Amanita muscaria]